MRQVQWLVTGLMGALFVFPALGWAAEHEVGLPTQAQVFAQDATKNDGLPPQKGMVEAKGVDVRVRRLTDALARALKRLPGDIRDQRFAVMPFQESGGDTQDRQLGLVVADLVVTNLARDHRLALTERSQLNRIIEEQELGAMGFIEPEQAARIGVLAGATALVLGEVLDLGQSFQVGARVVNAASGQILAVETTELPKSELLALSADAVVLRSRSGAFFRSLVAPGWGQLYNREPGKAAIVGLTLGALWIGSAGTALSGWLAQASYDRFGEPAG